MPIRRRALEKEDLIRMQVPRRFWKVHKDEVSDFSDKIESQSPRDIVDAYLEQIEGMRDDGCGLLLWGKNGTGKTAIAVIIAKEYRRRFSTVLFLPAAHIKDYVIQKIQFDEDESYWQRALSVDVLVIDDLGKGTVDGEDFTTRLLDDLVRSRCSNRQITIITTNMNVKKISSEADTRDNDLKTYLKASTVNVLKEHVIAVHVRGEDRRDESYLKMKRNLIS